MAKILSKDILKEQIGKKLHELAEHVTSEDRKLAQIELGKVLNLGANVHGENVVSVALISRYFNNKIGNIEAATKLYEILSPIIRKRQKALVKKIGK